jgi:uncharacterized SAM-binding protein YcdF (DUF218 family)
MAPGPVVRARPFRFGFAAVLFGLLLTAGCASIERLAYDPERRCGQAATEALADVQWDQAREIDVVVSSGEFTPAIVELRRRRPYRLTVHNLDAVTRVFKASEFFHAAALAGLDRGGGFSDDECISMIVVPPQGAVEARLMPLRRGRFEVSESYLPLGTWGSGLGAVTVR